MIVVATADFEIYHDVVSELRARGVGFTTIEPGDDLPDRTAVLITAPDDLDTDVDLDRDAGSKSESEDEIGPSDAGPERDSSDDESGVEDVEVVVAESKEPRRAVDEALTTLRDADGRTVIGVDPGENPGIAVCAGDVVVAAAFQVSLTEAATVIRREVSEASEPIVRIGDGARLRGASVIDDLEDLTVELVDETGTTPYLGSGARGMGDVLAAANIARLPGDRVTTREIEPTPGEIETIKRRSRERSGGNRTIDEALARQVARGKLTVEEALNEHRNG